MGQIYLSNPRDVQLKALIDITGALTTTIVYRTPTGTEGTLTATVVTALTGEIRHQGGISDTYAALANTAGNWRFWTRIKFSDSREFDGEPHIELILASGDSQ